MTSNVIQSYEHNKKGPRKDLNFYRSVVDLYANNPDKAKEIIKVLPKIGYYKDFFFILEVSNNDSLNNYIYDLIINLMSKWPDNQNLILAKWLPREDTSFDRKYKFVNTFSLKLFPNDKFNERKKKYRELVSQTAKKLNILETNLCARTYDKIEILTENNLKTYEKLFLKNPLLQQRLLEILEKRYQNYNMIQLINEYDIKTLHKLRVPLLNKYIELKKQDELYHKDCLMILDISGGMFNNNSANLYSRIIVYSINHTELIINGMKPRLITFEQNLNMKQVKTLIDSNLDYCDNINIKKCLSLVKNKYKNYTIVSNKSKNLDSKLNISWDIINGSYMKRKLDLQILRDILGEDVEMNIIKFRFRINIWMILFFIFLIMITC